MNSNRMTQLRELAISDPTDVFIKYAIALEYLAIGENTEAVTHLKNLILTHPNYLPSYYQLGQMLESAGKTAEAILIYKSGATLAEIQKENKTKSELLQAIENLTED